MTEHVHEWEAGKNQRGPIAICKCSAWMEREDILCRLNATERLSAEDALKASNIIAGESFYDSPIDDALQAYADILEGK